MAGYRRFVAYVYEYRKGKKESNCGFVKVEVRDARCTMEVHLHVKGLAPDAQCRVYGFLRKDGLINGILLGSCDTGEEKIECLIETDSLNMGDSGISLGRMGGMVMLTDSGGFFGTEWDDQPIRPDNFLEMKITRAPEKESAEEDANKDNTSPGSSENEVSNVNGASEMNQEDVNQEEAGREEIMETEREEIMPIKNPEENVKMKEKIEEGEEIEEIGKDPGEYDGKRVETGEMQASDVDHVLWQQETQCVSTDVSKQAPQTPGKVPEEQPGRPAPPSAGPQPGRPAPPPAGSQPGRPVPPSAGPQPERPIPPSAGPRPGRPAPPPAGSRPERPTPPPERPQPGRPVPPAPPRPQRRSIGEEFQPFEDSDRERCWKIQLQDLRFFPRRNSMLRNNRFLQYGYHNFGHLLLCRKANGQYILGVPGSYDQQERFMAGMYGFPYFRESRLIQIPKGRGGYWYRSVDAPDFH